MRREAAEVMFVLYVLLQDKRGVAANLSTYHVFLLVPKFIIAKTVLVMIWFCCTKPVIGMARDYSSERKIVDRTAKWVGISAMSGTHTKKSALMLYLCIVTAVYWTLCSSILYV